MPRFLRAIGIRPNVYHTKQADMIGHLRAATCTQGMSHTQNRESTLYELCDWMDGLARRVGAGVLHEVRDNTMHAFQMVMEDGGRMTRVEVY